MMFGRQLWVVVHRWAGLVIAAFLIVAGATGALMPFYEELNGLAAPWRIVSPPSPGARPLDPLVLRDKALAALPNGATNEFIGLSVDPHRTFDIFPELPAGQAWPYHYVALDPYTGDIVHRGTRADLSDGMSELVPFILQLHFSLALGAWGTWAFGVAAMIWTIDCFVGFYLTLPISRRGWLRRWRKAWTMRLPAPNGYRFNCDLHRAGGLWLWPMLFVFAWSSVGMNLRSVYDPVMNGIGFGRTAPTFTTRPAAPGYRPDWPRAVETGRRLARERGRRDGFTFVRDGYITFDAGAGVFSYNFASSRDITDGGAASTLSFDMHDRVVAASIADGSLTNGGADVWLMSLHEAQIGGLAYRIFVSLLGFAIVALSITGILIWMKKRSARILGKRKISLLRAASKRRQSNVAGTTIR